MIKKLSIFIEKEMNRQHIRSANQLAKLCNNKISPDFINKIKRQEPQTVTLDTLIILANGFNLTLKELLENSGIIEDYGIYGLSLEEANKITEQMSGLFDEYANLDISMLSDYEKVILANNIYDYIKTVSLKFY